VGAEDWLRSPMYKLANLSLGNRALIALVTLFVMVFGVVSTTQLRQELVPSISLPTAVIYTTYPGASPEVVEQRVTEPVEQAVLGLNNLESTTSASSTGVSSVQVNLQYGSNMATAQQDLQASMSRLESALPDDADWQVITGSLDDLPVVVMSVSDDANNPAALAERVDDLVIPELEKIDGVRSVQVSGAPVKQVSIQLDLDKLTDNNLTPGAVSQLLSQSGALVSGGTVQSGNQTLSVTIGNKLASAADVGKLQLTIQPPAPQQPEEPAGEVKSIPLTDVAKVVQVNAPEMSISRTDGEPSLTIAVTKTPDGNTVQISQAIADQLPDLESELASNATFTTVFDQAPFITQSIQDLLTEGGLGLVMAIIVILIFLLSLRSTLVTAVSIPVSVLICLIGLRVSDYTLNLITLGALTISVGRVVDDSIVVIENIKRHLSYGEDKITAIKTAVREVATAITAATITTVAVFLPLGLVGGQTGELFRPFAVTVTLALAASLFVALTIVPVLAYWFLKSPDQVRDRAEVEAEARESERRSVLQRGYVPVLRWSIKHPVVAVLIAILLLGGTVAGATSGALKTDFLGQTGQNTLTVSQKFTPGLSLSTQNSQAKQVEAEIRDVRGVDTVQTTVGNSGGAEGAAFGFGGAGDTASFSVTTDADADQAAIAEDLRTALDEMTGVGELSVNVGQGFGGASTVDVIITAPDTKRLQDANAAVLDAMADVEGATDVSSTLAASQPLVQVTVDREEAALAGLTEQTIAQSLRGVLSPQQVGQTESDGTTSDIVLDLGDKPVGLAELRKVKIATSTGEVELDDVADVMRANVPTSLDHRDGQRSVTVSLTPTGDNLGTVNTAVTTALQDVDLPDGVSTEIGGVTADQKEAFSQLGLALLVAIAIVYVVMVATFKSLLQPLILMVSVPFAATGALAALLITGTPLGVPSLIGLLMLIGIVVTNAIVLIDLVNRYRAAGDSVDEALIDGARQRLRPILMTALATIFALVPMSLGLTGGGVFISQPLAVVVIGGLVSSTLLTLVLVPVLYHLLESRRERRRQARSQPAGSADAGRDRVAGDGGRPGSDGSGAAGATAATENGQRRTDRPENGRADYVRSENGRSRPFRSAPDGTVQLPASAVAGLATAAEGLAQAFRSMAIPDVRDVLDLQPEAWEIESDPDQGVDDEPADAGSDDDDADLGRRGPRHAR